jgi:hypothetical protein
MPSRPAHPRTRLTIALASTMSVVAVACRDLGPGETDCLTENTFGSFVGRAGGAATDSLAGCAYFTTDTPSGRFRMVLTNGGPQSTSHVVRLFLLARPRDTGTFTLSGGLSGAVFLGDRRFTLTNGTMKVTSASRFRRLIDGNVTLTGVDNGEPVTITGTFFARCVEGASEVGPDRPREEWSAFCDDPSCFPFSCPLLMGGSNIDTVRRARRAWPNHTG